MRFGLLTASVVAGVAISAGIALAQSPTAPPAPSLTAPAPGNAPGPAVSAPAAGEAAPPAGRSARRTGKSRECRQEAKQKGLRGNAARGEVAICMAEARLACAKQAAASNLGKRELKAFIRQCMGRGERQRRGK
jgi:hypothetical protein